MKTFAAIAALAVCATARLTQRGDNQKCCFSLTANGGGLSGSVGELDDGQARIGGGLPPSHFCITDNGEITDQSGRGCILTSHDTQLQCDTGASPTTGFSVNSQGLLMHGGSTHFVACRASPDEFNIYTNPPPSDVTGCVDITLTASGCAPKTKTVTITSTVQLCPASSTPPPPASTPPPPPPPPPASTLPPPPPPPPASTSPPPPPPPASTPPPPPPPPASTPPPPPPPQPTPTQPANCPMSPSGNELPHLIVPIDSAQPDTAAGTSFSGTISETVSTIFNFDVPESDAGKICSLVFLFPEQSQLQTSSFTFSGDGQIDVAELTSPATQGTTFNNAPGTAQDFGVTTIAPGNSYTIATFDCPAGKRVGFEVSNAGSTDFQFFEDFNPCPIGLFMTTS